MVDDAVEIGAKAVWMQQGPVHNRAAGKVRQSGLRVVQSKCVMRQHHKATGFS